MHAVLIDITILLDLVSVRQMPFGRLMIRLHNKH